jgi:hypothetical protein
MLADLALAEADRRHRARALDALDPRLQKASLHESLRRSRP